MIVQEPPRGAVCLDRLGQAWKNRTDLPFGWERTGSGTVTGWDAIPLDLRDSFVRMVAENAPAQFTGSPDVVFSIDDRLYWVARDQPVSWRSERDRAVCMALLRFALERSA